MPIDPSKLAALAGTPLPQQLAPLPAPWGVTYAAPNSDGSRKNCMNCVLWARDEKCLLHQPSLVISGTQVCGYHVHGQPHESLEPHNLQPLDPSTSGLEEVPGGASCDVCRYYQVGDMESGTCVAVLGEENAPAVVQPRGCCSRWESFSEPMEQEEEFEGLYGEEA